MKNQNAGFTLIEVLVAGVFLLVFAGLGITLLGSLSGGHDRAEQALAEYSQQAGLVPLNCTGRDTDGDGYISCTAKDEVGSLIPLQCSSSPFNSGCKLAIPAQRYVP